MAEFRCPLCGKGVMRTEVIPRYLTRLTGIRICVENARIERCDTCDKESFDCTELMRWEEIRKKKLLDMTPGPM